MSDPPEGDDTGEGDGQPPGEASDEEVRAAMSTMDGEEPPDGVMAGGSPSGEPTGDADDAAPDGNGDPVERDEETADSTESSRVGGDAAGGTDPGLREEDLAAPASATDGDHTLLEEYERQQRSAWRSYARTGAFWGGLLLGSVALTTTAFVSLVQSGLPQRLAFMLATVSFAVVVGFVFLSLQRD